MIVLSMFWRVVPIGFLHFFANLFQAPNVYLILLHLLQDAHSIFVVGSISSIVFVVSYSFVFIPAPLDMNMCILAIYRGIQSTTIWLHFG